MHKPMHLAIHHRASPSLALAMIVRDEQAQLPACLASAAPWMNEIVIGDTGSADASPEIARAHGARVVSVPWTDDFAAARNAVLEHVTADWVLVLDADERLDPGPDPAAWAALRSQGPDAFQVSIHNYVHSLDARVWDLEAQPNPLARSGAAGSPDLPSVSGSLGFAERGPAPENDGGCAEAAAYPAVITHHNVRLFRRCPEIYFVGCLHESVGPRVQAAGLRLGKAVGCIHHFGLAAAPEAVAAKNHRYRQLARRKVAEMPNDPQAHFELGLMEFENFHDDAEALRCFERCLRLRPGFALAWLFGGAALLRLDHPDDALAFFVQARHAGYRSARLAELEGDALYRLGRFSEAALGFRQAGLDSKRGLAELRAGHPAAGFRHLRRACAASPGRPDVHDRLVAALVFIEDWPAAIAAQCERVRQFPEDVAGRRRLAALQQRHQELALAI